MQVIAAKMANRKILGFMGRRLDLSPLSDKREDSVGSSRPTLYLGLSDHNGCPDWGNVV